MTQDSFDNSGSPPARRRGRAGRNILMAGVAGACLLGAGVGFWARPTESERPVASRTPEVAPSTPVIPHRLQIVVDERSGLDLLDLGGAA